MPIFINLGKEKTLYIEYQKMFNFAYRHYLSLLAIGSFTVRVVFNLSQSKNLLCLKLRELEKKNKNKKKKKNINTREPKKHHTQLSIKCRIIILS